MTPSRKVRADVGDITTRRLASQHLISATLTNAQEVVSLLGAVQAQDYAGAKWAIGQRLLGGLDTSVEQAMTDGAILRTHVLRPTWHFVTPADIRWMLALTGPRVNKRMIPYDRQLELDEAVYRKSNRTLERALRDGSHLTRLELRDVLIESGIDAKHTQRLAHIMMRAELEGVVCSGALRGKQFTYALLDARVPPAPAKGPDESLHELTMRYFNTRGPATPQDFAWWSGLTVPDAKKGIQLAGDRLQSETIEDRTYWFDPFVQVARKAEPMAHLLPNYDEYFIGYRDRSAIGHVLRDIDRETITAVLFAHVVAVNGQLVGGWKRKIARGAVTVELNLLTRVSRADKQLIATAAERYGAFLQLPVHIQ